MTVDGNHPSVQQAVNEGLINEGFMAVFSKKDLQKWNKHIYDLLNIYEMNAGLEQYQNSEAEYRELKLKEESLKVKKKR